MQRVGHAGETGWSGRPDCTNAASPITSRVMHGNGDDPIEDFPLGDGTADTVATVVCPYCGEENEIGVDPGSGDSQDYIEDCQVCCRPWLMYVKYARDGTAEVEVYASDS